MHFYLEPSISHSERRVFLALAISTALVVPSFSLGGMAHRLFNRIVQIDSVMPMRLLLLLSDGQFSTAVEVAFWCFLS